MNTKKGLAICLTALTFGCAGELDSMMHSGNDGISIPTCDADDTKSWDLGTGRSDDIKRLAPAFFEDGAMWRYRALQDPIAGVADVHQMKVGNADGFELVTKEPNYRIRAIWAEAGTLVLMTPGECPHVRALDRCINGHIRTEVHVEGAVSCLGPISVPREGIMITLEGDSERLPIKLGDVQVVRPAKAGDLSFDVFLQGREEPAGHVKRSPFDTKDPLATEALALLRPGGLEKAAAPFYKGLPASAKTAQLDQEVVQLRTAGAKRVAATYTDPARLAQLISLHTMKAMPGDDEVFSVVDNRIREVLPNLADNEVSGEDFKNAGLAFAFYVKHSGQPLDLPQVEAKYGPLLTTSWAQQRDLQRTFAAMFPESKYVREREQALERQAEDRRQEYAEQARQAGEASLWDDVSGRGDEIATLTYKIRFGQQNFVKSRHNVRGLASMQLYRDGLVRDAFCPAKRAFVSAKGAAEFNRRAAAHCKESAPVDVGVGGIEKTLTADCQATFATGC